MIRRLFFNAEEGRLRALVRVGLHGLALLGVMVLNGLLSYGLRRSSVAALREAHDPLVMLGGFLGVGLSVWAAAAWLDRRRLTGLGLRADGRAFAEILLGTLLGVVLIEAVAITEGAAGWATFAPRAVGEGGLPLALGIAYAFAIFVGVAFEEELLFRGYHLTNMAEGLRGLGLRGVGGGRLGGGAATWAALLFSSALFGLAHLGNPHASAISTLNIAVGGLLLGVGYLWTGRLSLPIGVHLGWNFAQNLFGMPVSGQGDFFFGAALERALVEGPGASETITGGDFGPEAGLLGLGAMILGIFALALIARTTRARSSRGSLAPAASIAQPPSRSLSRPVSG